MNLTFRMLQVTLVSFAAVIRVVTLRDDPNNDSTAKETTVTQTAIKFKHED